MRFLRVSLARIRGLFAGAAADAELREELETHLAMHIDENIRRGMPPDEARRQALLAAGGLTIAAESVRERRGLPWIESVAADVRYAARTLRIHRTYSAAVILTVALAVGANAAMFTIVNAVVLKPLPYPEPDRILSISLKDAESDRGVVDDKTYGEWARSATTASVAVSFGAEMLVAIGGETRSVTGRSATASYFPVLGVRPRNGRVFTTDEDAPGGPNVVVVSEQFWRGYLASDSTVLGRILSVNGKPSTIIGVMPASFTTDHGAQLWVPVRLAPPPAGTTRYYPVIARLRDDVSMDAARAELAVLRRRVESQPVDATFRSAAPPAAQEPVVMTLHERRYGDARRPLLLLFGAVGVLLLIACANLANLSLARATRREREFAVRVALGASRTRLARYVFCECLLLSLLGAAVGLALSAAAVAYFVRLSPKSVGNMEGIHADGRVLLFTLAVAVFTAIVFGLVPARTAGLRGLAEALSNGSPRFAGTPRQRWLGRILVVSQLATALMLITGAGIVARTFWRVASLDVGFRPDQLFVIRMQLPPSRYRAAPAQAFIDDMLLRIRAMPGIERAAYTSVVPVSGVSRSMSQIDSTGQTSPTIDVVEVGPGYLETIEARLVAGRLMQPEDRSGSAAAAVITETAARALYPNGLSLEGPSPLRSVTILGVIKDIRQWDLESAARPTMYQLPQESIGNRVSIVARTKARPQALENEVRRIVRTMDPLLPSPTFATLDDKLAELAAPRRFTFVLLGLFAAMAGVLAVIGLYGVLSYLVANRTREIGIRMALGADVRRVRRLVIGQGMMLTTLGIAIGVIGSVSGARILGSLVYQASVYDTQAFVWSAALLAIVAYVACFVPAQRASRADPLAALRSN